MPKKFTLKKAKGWENHDPATPLTEAQIAELGALLPLPTHLAPVQAYEHVTFYVRPPEDGKVH